MGRPTTGPLSRETTGRNPHGFTVKRTRSVERYLDLLCLARLESSRRLEDMGYKPKRLSGEDFN